MTQKLVSQKKKTTNHNHNKYITTPEFNKLITENFAARLAQANLITKTDFDNRKTTSNNTRDLLIENELKILKIFDSSYFHGKSHFQDDGTQTWLVIQLINRYFKTVSFNDRNILSWKSKRLSDESIKPPTTTNNFLNPSLYYVGTKAKVKFSGDCLKQEKITFIEIERSVNISNYPTMENCLFDAVELTKHVDVDKYKYSGYDIAFDR